MVRRYISILSFHRLVSFGGAYATPCSVDAAEGVKNDHLREHIMPYVEFLSYICGTSLVSPAPYRGRTHTLDALAVFKSMDMLSHNTSGNTKDLSLSARSTCGLFSRTSNEHLIHTRLGHQHAMPCHLLCRLHRDCLSLKFESLSPTPPHATRTHPSTTTTSR